jgi:hypothetical protein
VNVARFLADVWRHRLRWAVTPVALATTVAYLCSRAPSGTIHLVTR